MTARCTRLGLAIAAAVAATLWAEAQPGAEQASGGVGRPNVVLITTDDQTAASLEVMKRTVARVGDRGASFSRYFASYPLCCPARTTWITGQYPHNHGVIDNLPANGGGYAGLREPDRVLPAWLDEAGYDTALVGKWIHNYEQLTQPPGWDRWWGLVPATAAAYYDYELADSEGGLSSYGTAEDDYQTDVITREYAVPFIRAHAADPDPFLLHVSYTAPHWGRGRADPAGRRCASPTPFSFKTARAKPATRHAERFRHRELPRPPSFDERELADKPAIVRRGEPIRRAERREIAKLYRCELASLLAVDQGVARIDEALAAAGLAQNTYVIFTSDNGYLHGEHRIRSDKVQPYEEAIRVPLLIRGPGIPAGVRVGDPAGDVDLAPTISRLTGVEQPPGLERPQDGRSLVPYLVGGRAPGRAILIEAKRPPQGTPTGAVVRSFIGVRTRRYAYIERYDLRAATLEDVRGSHLGAGELVDRELYDLRRDPYQLDSRHANGRYAATRETLAAALAELRACDAAGCLLDVGIPPPVGRR